MVEGSLYLVFSITEDRSVKLMLISSIKEVKSGILEPPLHLSEALWNIIPKWLPTEKIDSLKGIAYSKPVGKGTYSTIRTILSILNTLATVESIPIAIVEDGDSGSEIIKKIHSQKIKEVIAQY